MNMPNTRQRSPRRLATLAVAATLLAACGSSENEPGQASGEQPVAPAATDPPVTTAAPTTTAPTTTIAPTTTAAPTTTTTEPPCEVKCPIEDTDYALIGASVAAYNSGDWDTWLGTIADEAPFFATPIGDQTTALVEFDFIWSAAMNEVWTLGECLDIRGDIHCEVTIEDDLHRGLADVGLEPAECKIIVAIDDGLVDWKKYDLYPCHSGYDVAMHTFGGWFSVSYPGEVAIDGHHYRGWNQPDITAGQRAQDHLQIWLDSGPVVFGESLDH